MTQGGYGATRRRSPTGLAVVVALHGAALVALFAAKGPMVDRTPDRNPQIIDVPIEPPPPPEVPDQPPPPEMPSQIDIVSPRVPPPLPQPGPTVDNTPTPDVPSPPLPPGPDIALTRPVPSPLPPPPLPDRPAPPVRVDARLDPRYAAALQPDYPSSEVRAEREGSVTIRVAIGRDGRVSAAECVRATTDAFCEATRDQALRRWRFKPATEDGRPIESSKTMTVRFELESLRA